MAWGFSRTGFGVCGNFKFEFHALTDAKATRSLVYATYVPKIHFSTSVNTTDNADTFNAQSLSWTGTTDAATANELTDSSEVFDPVLTGLQAVNNTDGKWMALEYKDADELYTMYPNKSARATQIGTAKAYTIKTERVVQVTAVSANDDGTLILIG